ncbi:MAG: nucleotidyl transferase AbiEii/AbiGii toxin family protein [Candidatus Omnitrophica bacterium]|nr:nucleotidyl transferase AbiEii/AbiGii toxin family protein [Candidatus Omnitrophota bacterium]
MLSLKNIESFYPTNLKPFKRNILREYLQYKILEIIFDSPYGAGLSFMGGTAIQIVHGNTRFSEDLDFDNLSLKPKDFEKMTQEIMKRLKLSGYTTQVRINLGDVCRAYIRFSDVLFDLGLTGHKEEKILIQVDTQPQKFKYSSDKIILNKFDVFLRINVVPVDILLSQKLFAALNRPRPMGRDFFDIVYLSGKTTPNYPYLTAKLGIKNAQQLKTKLNDHCKNFNFKQLALDVEPFLYAPGEVKKVVLFREFIEQSL